jgi:hypothetical protein
VFGDADFIMALPYFSGKLTTYYIDFENPELEYPLMPQMNGFAKTIYFQNHLQSKPDKKKFKTSI